MLRPTPPRVTPAPTSTSPPSSAPPPLPHPRVRRWRLRRVINAAFAGLSCYGMSQNFCSSLFLARSRSMVRTVTPKMLAISGFV